MELLNVLAVVDNPAFIEICSRFVTFDGQFDDDTPRPVCPTWRCRLVWKLATEDALSTQNSVSWAELFGFPDDPWEYSTEFWDMMQQLVAKADTSGEWWHSHSIVEWRTSHEAMKMRGIQRNPWGDSEPTATAELFARELGKRMSFDVPPVVHLCATINGSALLDAWSVQDPRPATHVLENRVWTLKADFADPTVTQLTEALARARTTSLKIRLDARRTERQHGGMAMLNAGFLFTTLLCGRSLCQLPGVTRGDIVRRQKLTDIRVAYPWASERTLGGFYSVVAVSSTRNVSTNVYFEDGDGDEDLVAVNSDDAFNHSSNNVQWRWLAYALWSSMSSSHVQHMDLATFALTARDVRAVESVLQSSYPHPAIDQNAERLTYGFAELREGTRFQPQGLEDGEDTTLVLSHPFRCRALHDSADTSDRVDAVIPGFGVCKVGLSGETRFTPDNYGANHNGETHSRPMEYFKLFVNDVESSTVLTDLLALIGGKLGTLWFGNTGTNLLTVDLGAIAVACPNLEQLTLSDVRVMVSEHNDTLRKWPLNKLLIDGVVSGLDVCFDDPSFRMSRELVHLTVDVPRGWNFGEEMMEALMAHDGDFLSVTKESISNKSKAAMISVWAQDNVMIDPAVNIKAIHRLDVDMLKLIFGFAATPEKRSVQVTRDSARFSNVVLDEHQGLLE